MAATGKKRKLEELDVDEFMQSGFDSASNSDDDNHDSTPAYENKLPRNKKVKSLAQEHKKSLKTLQEKDPEFYKFLQDNDQELLNFSASDDDNETTHELPEKLALDSDDSEAEDNTQRNDKKKQIDVSVKMIKEWVETLKKENILEGSSNLIEAFKAAVEQASGESNFEASKYSIEGSSIFNRVVQVCLSELVPAWHRFLKLPSNDSKLPENSKRWKKLRSLVKVYLTCLVRLSASLTESTVIRALLKHLYYLAPFCLPFPKVTKYVLKKLISHWATGEESVRVLAFLSINKIVRLSSNSWLDFAIKSMYMEYVRNCKFTSPNTLPQINFMQRCLVEVLVVNASTAYQHAFVFIRQLAIHLRNALTTIKKETLMCVYNWQFIHCLYLWSRLLATIYPNPTLEPLIYPLVQIITAVIKLAPASKYYPLRFNCIGALNMLSRETNVFIPVLPFILEVLEQTDFNKKFSKVTMKPFNFTCMLKLSKAQLGENGFKDGVIEQVCNLLFEYLSTKSHTISFPELVLPAIKQIKTFLNKCHVANYCRNLKDVLNKIEESAKFINDRRECVTFKVTDTAAVDAWENTIKCEETPLGTHYARWKKLRDSEMLLQISGKEQMDDYKFPTIHRPMPLKQQAQREEFKELLPSSESDSDSEEFFKPKDPNSTKSVTVEPINQNLERKDATIKNKVDKEKSVEFSKKEEKKSNLKIKKNRQLESMDEDKEPLPDDIVVDFTLSSDEDTAEELSIGHDEDDCDSEDDDSEAEESDD